jgi:hypothetical protein
MRQYVKEALIDVGWTWLYLLIFLSVVSVVYLLIY